MNDHIITNVTKRILKQNLATNYLLRVISVKQKQYGTEKEQRKEIERFAKK